MTKKQQRKRRIHLGLPFMAPLLVWQMGGGIACTEIPLEEPTHRCIPEGQCPDVHPGVSLSEGDGAQGARLFALHCASCHGADGTGAKPGVGDLTKSNLHAPSRSAQVAATIRNGRGSGMPAFPLSNQSIANLVAFVRSIAAPNPTTNPRPGGYP